jgi:glutaredoxin/glutathione-dependent peroxiredoxin
VRSRDTHRPTARPSHKPNKTPQVGDTWPDVTLKHLAKTGSPEDVKFSDLGAKVVVCGVPGAFTPTCSKTHAPGFISQLAAFKAKGATAVAVVSVNDAFVMGAWAKSLVPDEGGADGLYFLADGNGELAEKLGLVLDAAGFGMGKRCRRFAAVVEDGKVTALNVEEGGGLTCSRAEDVLAAL